MCIHLCVCIWLLVWTYWYAHICVCVGECVFAIFIWHFNPSSVFLYIIYIANCAIILLRTLMLYICDRSTPDLNKDDELKIKNCSGDFRRRHEICTGIFMPFGYIIVSCRFIWFIYPWSIGLFQWHWEGNELRRIYQECCVKSRYRGQGQVITSHRYCGM